jgi:hypothetical protein
MGAGGSAFSVDPQELAAASRALAGIEREMSIDNPIGVGGMAGDLGDAALQRAVGTLADRIDMTAAGLNSVLTAAGARVGDAGRSYAGADVSAAQAFGGLF